MNKASKYFLCIVNNCSGIVACFRIGLCLFSVFLLQLLCGIRSSLFSAPACAFGAFGLPAWKCFWKLCCCISFCTADDSCLHCCCFWLIVIVKSSMGLMDLDDGLCILTKMDLNKNGLMDFDLDVIIKMD